MTTNGCYIRPNDVGVLAKVYYAATGAATFRPPLEVDPSSDLSTASNVAIIRLAFDRAEVIQAVSESSAVVAAPE